MGASALTGAADFAGAALAGAALGAFALVALAGLAGLRDDGFVGFLTTNNPFVREGIAGPLL